MKTFFVVSDVHGFYTQMLDALVATGFDRHNKDHIFVSLGDLLDRGLEAVKCLEFVNNLPADRKILIRGNHEDLLETAIARHEFRTHDITNGTVSTVEQLTGYMPLYEPDAALESIRKNESWNKYLNSTIDYYETDNYIFVHGWIPCYYNRVLFTYNENWRYEDWTAARWYCGFDAWNDGVVEKDKTILCGHWHTSYGHSVYHHDGSEFGEFAIFEPFYDNGIIGLDACTVYSKKVNCITLQVED